MFGNIIWASDLLLYIIDVAYFHALLILKYKEILKSMLQLYKEFKAFQDDFKWKSS